MTMTDSEQTIDAINFLFKSQGYVNVKTVSKFSGVPCMIVENVLKNENFVESNKKGNWIKKGEDK